MRTALCLVILLLLPLPAASASASLFAPPLHGEGALYEVTTEGVLEPAHVYFTWDMENVLVPGSLGRSLVTLRTTVIPEDQAQGVPVRSGGAGHGEAVLPFSLFNPGRDYAQRDPPHARQLSSHVTTPGGDLLARTTEWFETESHEGTTKGQWMHRSMRAGPCDLASIDALLARITGHPRDVALGILAGCGAEATYEKGVLIARFGETTLRVTPSGHVFPSGWTYDSPTLHREAKLVGWRAGEGALGRSAPFDPVVEIPLVEWSAQGPSRGDLGEHRFRDAQASIAHGTPEGRAWFAAHPDGLPLFATHAWSDPAAVASGASDPWANRVKGVPCGPTEAPAVGSSVGEWSMSWVAPGASLFAIADRAMLPAPLSQGVERAVVVQSDDYGTAQAGVPTTRAPAPADLVRHLRDLDAYQLRGVYSIDYAFVPTDHGNTQAAAAAISRGTCERNPATGELAYSGISMWFVDGKATSIVGTFIEREEDTPLSGLMATLAPPQAGSPVRAVLPPLALWTGAALVGGALLALFTPRVFQALYSRIHRGSALDSEKRARLIEAVHRRPGASARSLADELGMPVNTLEHHARVLCRLKYLRRVRTREGVAYYASEHPRAPFAHVLDLTHAEDVLATLAQQSDLTQQELAFAVGASPSHVSELLKRLEREGLIERRRDGRVVRVRLTPRAAEIRLVRT